MFRKTLIFIDGENLVLRYQEMLKSGRIPKADTIHVQDAFAWHPRISRWSQMDVLRVSFYTSIQGDEQKLAEIAARISNTLFECATDKTRCQAQIVPRVFKKDAGSRRSRLVDIQITIDIMNAAFSMPIDTIMLVSGDGDFIPLISEVMRRGKQIHVAALSSGLNDKIPSSVDTFIPLDDFFFEEPGYQVAE